MSIYIVEQGQIQNILESLQNEFTRCKELQQQYVIQWETHQVESPEMVMEIIEDLDTYAHSLVLLGKQWEQLQAMQQVVLDHYIHATLDSLAGEEPIQEEAPYEGYEGYDVSVALGLAQVALAAETEESSAPNEATTPYEEPQEEEITLLELEPVEVDSMEHLWQAPTEPWQFDAPLEEEKEKKKKKCKHCTGDSLDPLEREKCCHVKKEKKKKEKHKGIENSKEKGKKKDKSIQKWAKKLSKWEQFATEHGDEWTEKVLAKVAKKLEKKADKVSTKHRHKAMFKKHKLDRFARLHEEE